MAGNDAQVQMDGGTRQWRYKGVSFDGQRKEKGVVEAQTRDQAIERIKKLGLYPTDLVDTAAGTGLNAEINIKAFEKYPSKKDFAVMARQLATMVAAGVSLIRALNIVAEQIENVKLRKAVQACVAQVEGGSSFSEAMSADPDSLFPPIMVNMVRAGETGGFLDKSLLTVADSFEADVRLQGQIKSAMAYPVVVLGIALILVMVMLLTIVPMFASMYDSMNAQLPFVTQILVDLGKVMPYVLPVLIVAVVARWPCSGSATVTKTSSAPGGIRSHSRHRCSASWTPTWPWPASAIISLPCSLPVCRFSRHLISSDRLRATM